MTEDLSFESTIRRTRTALLLSGIRLEDVKFGRFTQILFNNLFYLNFFCLHTDVIAEIFALFEGIQTGRSFVELSLTAPCMTISLLGTSRSIFLFKHENVIIKVIDKLKSIHPEVDANDDNHPNEAENTANVAKNLEDDDYENDKTILSKSMKYLNSMNNLFSSTTTVVVTAFSLIPAVSMTYAYYKTGVMEIRYPYLTKYFFNHYTKERWPFVYLHQAYSTVIVGANLIGADTLYYALCMHVNMHFRLLCNRYQKCTAGSPQDVQKNFKECVVRHQELIQLVDDMELLYSKSNLFNIVTASILICLNGFNLSVTRDVVVIMMFLAFLAMALCQVYLLCSFADLLMQSSTAVILAIYKSSWYNTDNSTKKSILFVITRAQKPCKLTACNFADLNLNAFTTILSRSWSYFALLRTMID